MTPREYSNHTVLERRGSARHGDAVRWLVPVVLLWAWGARAHDADVIYVMVKHGAQPDLLVESVTLTPATLAFLAPLDADGDQLLSQTDLDAKRKALRVGFWEDVPLGVAGKPCELVEAGAWLREGFIELQGQFRCGAGELRQDFRILRVLPPNYRVVLGSQLDGEGQGRGFAQGSLTTIPIPRPPPPGSWDAAGFGNAFEAGVRRGLSLEVLAALLGLLLSIGAWKRGLLASALGLAGVAAGSWFSLEWWPPTILILLVTAGAAASKAPPLVLPLLLGAALGLREGGGGWPACLGVAAGTMLVLVIATPVALAIAGLLQRRAKILRFARWGPLLLGLVGVAVHARLSW